MAYDVTKIFQGAPMVKLGELITQRREKNSGLDVPVRGVSREGFINPKQEEADKTKYNVFYKYDFVFNPARMEVNSIALNTSIEQGICSSLYEIFSVDEERILPEFLNLFVKREEFARQCEYIGSGSAREYCRVANISEIEIPLPGIEVQREYVSAYRSLQQLAEQNEALAAPLQDACNAFLAKISAQYECALIGDLITEYSEKNTNNRIKIVKSVSVTKEFNDTNAKVNKNELSGYKIVPPLYISYVQTTKNEKCFASAINKYGYPIVVTSVNRVITSSNLEILDNEYLAMWFRTPEFSRWAIYNSWGSAREVFDFSDLCLSKIPLPPIEVQRSIVALYNCAEEARAIAKEAREQLKILAPAMVQRAANTPVKL